MDVSSSILATGLTKRFGDVTAVNDLSLNIKSGEIYGFLGLNGAGKTTTIRILLGMIKPTSGSVSLFGKSVQAGESLIWQRIGYLVETPHAYPDLTVRENLEIVRRLRHLSDANAVDDVMGQLNIAQYENRRAGTLSLGNAQRLGLAKAFIHHPDLLILDEPANGLDPAGIAEIRNLLKNLAENSGVTIFISSHILTEIARLATRIGIIHKGQLMKEINIGELIEYEGQRLIVDVRDTGAARAILEKAGIPVHSNHQNSMVITDRETMQHPDNVATLLVQGGCPPTRLVLEHGDLESYFLDLVGVKERE